MQNYKALVQKSVLAYYLYADEYDPVLSAWETYQAWRLRSGIIVKDPVMAIDILNLLEKMRTASREEMTYICTELDHITKEDLYVPQYINGRI